MKRLSLTNYCGGLTESGGDGMMLRRLGAAAISRAPRVVSRALSGAAPELPARVDTVVIGGGCVGASVALHLQQRGLSTLLLERHALTAGTTWHTAGMLWRLRPSYVDIELHGYTRELAIALEADPSVGVASWVENGGLFVAVNRERLAEYERLSEAGRLYGIESHVLSPTQTRDVHPLLEVSDVYGSMYSPTDGTLDPAGLTQAYTRKARNLGAKVHEGVSVASIETVPHAPAAGGVDAGRGTRVVAIHTADGQRVETTHVVNACGAWANELAATAGVQLPLLAMKHAYVVTDAIEGMHGGLPNVRDHDLSIYLKAQGSALALGGYETNPEFWRYADPSFAFGLFELDWETFLQNTEGHIRRCPAVESAGISSTVCGPESFTPDHKPLVGPDATVSGYWSCCGFNSMGMMLSGGMGRELAKWIETGASSLNLFAYDPARFHKQNVADGGWVRSTTHESYAKTYAIVFPHDEPLAGRLSRTSALHDALAKRGCVFQARHGYERPGWFDPSGAVGGAEAGPPPLLPKPYDYYGAYAEEGSGWRLEEGIDSVPKHSEHAYEEFINGELTFDWPASHELTARECAAARTGAALFDQSYFGKLVIDGPDADAAMQWLCGADVEGRVPGDVIYTPLCNAHGGVEADLTVSKLEGERGWYICTGGATQSRDRRWIARALEEGGYGLGSGKVNLHDCSDDLTLLSVQGPLSRRLLAPLVSDGALDNLSAFPFSSMRELSVAGVSGVRCLRLTFVGELGFELHMPAEHAPSVYAAIQERAAELAEATGRPIADAGYRAIDSLSAEKNFRHWHADLSNADSPLEAGIGFTVLPKLKRADAPDFLGRSALVAQRAAGLRKRLVCLVLDDVDAPPLHGSESLIRNGEVVGLVRSSAYGHTIKRMVLTGYANVPETNQKKPLEWLRQGEWAVSSRRGTPLGATLHLKAPFDPSGLRTKGEYEDGVEV